MKIRTRKRVEKQAPAPAGLGELRQLLMPMVAGMAATKQDLMSWVQDVGLEALKKMFEADAIVHPLTVLRGSTRVAAGAEIGPHVVAIDAEIGEEALFSTLRR